MEVELKPEVVSDDLPFQLLFHHHPLPMWIYALDTLAFLEVNAAAVALYGYSQEAFLSMTIKDIRPPEDVPRLLADVAQERPPFQHSGCWRHCRRDGSLIDVEITSHTLTFKGRAAALVIAQDITERRQAEAALRRLNRTYAVLNGINQALVRLREPLAVFQRACRVAVEEGGFRMAWVGLRDPASGQITVAAQAGVVGSYLKKLIVALNTTPSDPSPATSALHSGQCYVVNNIQQDPLMASRRKEALRHGYRSLVALPLRVNGVIRGVFTLYAAEPDFFDDDELNLLNGLALDISFALEAAEQESQRKEAEKALRELADNMAEAQRIAHLGSWEIELTPELTFVEPQLWSDECYRIFGYEPGSVQINPQLFNSRVHPDDRAAVEQALRRVIESGTANHYEYRLVRPDGSMRYVQDRAKVIRDERSGRPLKIVGTVQDITEQVEAKAQARLQSAALKAAANAIVITDREGTIQWVNPAFSQLTGYSLAEARGRNPRDLIKSGQQDPAVYRELWQTILAGQVWRGELVNRRKDGSFFTEEQIITPLRDESGQITHFIGIKQDITARKQLEAENQQLAEQFYQAQKLDSLGRLAGGIAHDFNNLLVPIVGYAELGLLKVSARHALFHNLEQIKAAGDRAAELTRQILAFSRQQVLEMTILDLNEIISEFQEMLTRLIGEDITLQTRLAADLPPLKGDKGQLEQVLLNLMVNARDAMPGGGTLIIETAQVTLDRLYTTRHAGVLPGPYLLLAVSDTGHGMDAATRQRIFEPFFTTKGPGRGTGLGLATVFGIVKQHEGHIWVYSEPGRGATFKIYFPLAHASAPLAEKEPKEVALLAGTETILLVEDETAVRALVSQALQGYGYRVLEAREPEHALKLAESYQEFIHLLLTDVIMPRMSGRELYQKLAGLRAGLKVLYMSGYTGDVIGHHQILEQKAAFLQKPFTLPGLLQAVRSVLEAKP